MTKTLIMQPTEDVLFDMDFSGLLRAGDDIASVSGVTVTPADFTPGATAFLGQVAQVRITTPPAGSYKVEIKVVSAAGDTREGEGKLLVKDL